MGVASGTTQWYLALSTGVVLNLSTGEQGVALGTNLGGVHHIPTEHVWQQSAGMDGRDHKGINRDAREIDLWFVVADSDTQDVRDVDSMLWDGLSFDQPSRLIAVTGGSGYRSTLVLLDKDPQIVHTKDPRLIGTLNYAVTLVAPDPWAHLLPITVPADGTSVPYAQWSSIVCRNRGKVAVPAVWQFSGPGTITMGFGTDTVVLPPLTAGQPLTVDTNPRNPVVTSGGPSYRWPEMGQQRLTQLIPVGDTTPVLTATGASAATSVSIAFTPLAERFW